jgi:hypothetical protein
MWISIFALLPQNVDRVIKALKKYGIEKHVVMVSADHIQYVAVTTESPVSDDGETAYEEIDMLLASESEWLMSTLWAPTRE